MNPKEDMDMVRRMGKDNNNGGTMPNKTQCKRCKADIMFIKYNNRSHPIDAKPKKVFVEIDGRWRFVNGHESHFATCPNADEFRQGK